MEDFGATIISIMTSKGGVGKTTSVCELASQLSRNENRVLVVDLDGQMDLTEEAGIEYNMEEWFQDEIEPDEDFFNEEEPEDALLDIYTCLSANCLARKAIQHSERYGFDIIPGSAKLNKADRYFGADPDDVRLLKLQLDRLRKQYDYILIDNPPARNIVSDMSIMASDYAIFVSDGCEKAKKGIYAIASDMFKYKFRKDYLGWSKIEILGIIITGVKLNASIFKAALDSYRKVAMRLEEKHLGTDLFVEYTRETVEVKEAELSKVSIEQYKKYSNVAVDYRKIVGEILKRIGK